MQKKLAESGGLLYDDEPDDSLESFVRLGVADGEDENSDEEEDDAEMDPEEDDSETQFGIPSNSNRRPFVEESDQSDEPTAPPKVPSSTFNNAFPLIFLCFCHRIISYIWVSP